MYRKLLAGLCLLFTFSYGVNAQNASYSLNSIPVTGTDNTAFGYRPLFSNTFGSQSSAFGFKSLYSNTDGIRNCAFGFQSLYSNTTGLDNVAFGFQALFSNIAGRYNTAVGNQALFSNGGGYSNTAMGYSALNANTASNNTAFGTNALTLNTTGSENSAHGFQAMFFNTTGILNSADGYRSLFNNTSGNYNSSSGSYALYYNTTGGTNTAYGSYSLISNITGSNNTALGFSANVGSGALFNATAIGSGASVNNSNSIQLGNSSVTEIFAGTGTTAKLIAGGLQITGGALGTGKVLTSDATGNATWQAPTGGGSLSWTLTGNAGTIDNTNFIGTTDFVPFNIRVNNQRAARIDPALFNNFFGQLSAIGNTTGTNNTAMGYAALQTNTTGSGNTAVGYLSNVGSAALTNATALGNGAVVNASNSIQLGNGSVTQVFAGTGTTARLIAGGLQITGGALAAGKVLTSDASGNATWQTPSGGGGGSGWGLTGNSGTVDGTNFIGTTDNVPFSIRVNNQPSGRIDIPARNNYYGGNAGSLITTGQNNQAFGYNSLSSTTTGGSNTAMGSSALSINTTGFNNSAFGTNASTTTGNMIEASAFGVGSLVNLSSKIRLGSTSCLRVETQNQYTVVSDGRFKDNVVEDDVKGLEFINQLRPVVYNFDTRRFTEFLTRNMPDSTRLLYFDNVDFKPSTSIRKSGFIAQEVEVAAQTVGYNFSGVHVAENEDDNYSLAYADFVVPLVKAVQQLSQQRDAMKAAMEEQKSVNESLKKEMDDLRKLVTDIAKGNVEGSIKISESGTDAKLFQNAPNPFTQSTVIRYTIPSAARRAVIIITSATGVKMKEFDVKNKTGESIDIIGGQLLAGTYIYSLIVDDKLVDSKQMILTR